MCKIARGGKAVASAPAGEEVPRAINNNYPRPPLGWVRLYPRTGLPSPQPWDSPTPVSCVASPRAAELSSDLPRATPRAADSSFRQARRPRLWVRVSGFRGRLCLLISARQSLLWVATGPTQALVLLRPRAAAAYLPGCALAALLAQIPGWRARDLRASAITARPAGGGCSGRAARSLGGAARAQSPEVRVHSARLM